MFDSTNYVIKKTRFFHKPIAVFWGMLLSVVYILMPIIMFAIAYFDSEEWSTEDFVIMVPFLWIFFIYGIFLLKEAIKMKKVENFKYNWWWIVKKVKVTAIKKTRANNGSRWNYIDVYYFEAEDSGMTYYSKWSTKWVLLWTSLEELKLLYAKYWFTYDEKQSQKEALLKKLDELIAEKEYEIENSWIISKIVKSKKSAQLIVDKTSISLGYIPTYRQIDDKKVTVWDTVDVYIDPDKPERYWVDTDFLF